MHAATAQTRRAGPAAFAKRLRRAKQDPPAAGGWDLFITFTPEMQLRSPIANPFMDSPCGGKAGTAGRAIRN